MEVKLFAQMLDALSAGRRVAVATVVATSGSTPRHPGARMAVADDGTTWGTIGGGRIEVEVIAAAREVANGGAPRRVRHHLVRDLAMCCGGTMDVAIGVAEREAIAAADQAQRSRTPLILETPGDGGAWRVVAASRVEARAWTRAREEDGVLREAIGLGERVLVFGAGHVGRAVAELAHRCDFEIVLCDDGETGALAAPPEWATVVDSFDLADAARALGGLGAGDVVLVVTRDHAVDQKLVEQLLAGVSGVDVDALAFTGMIGSRGKVGRFKKRAEVRGLLAGVGAERWARIHAPVGLDLGAETPEEIAIAVVAQLVAMRRRGEATAGAWGRS